MTLLGFRSDIRIELQAPVIKPTFPDLYHTQHLTNSNKAARFKYESNTLFGYIACAPKTINHRYVDQYSLRNQLSRDMKFPTMKYVRPAYAQSDQSLC